MTFNYIPAEEIVNIVLLELSSYFDANMVDESLLYSEIASCLEFLGKKVLPVKDTALTISNYCVSVPNDFDSLLQAMICEVYTETRTNSSPSLSYEKHITDIPACSTSCDFCKDDCGNLYQIYMRFEDYEYTLKNLSQLVLSSTSESFDSDCVCPTSSDYDITIKNGKFFTQFKEGTLYIKYKSKIMTNDGILIPDVYEIKEWLKFHLHYVIFRKLIRNKDDNVANLYQESKQEASIWKEIVRSKLKQKDFTEYMNLKAFLQRQFNMMSNTNGHYNTLIKRK